MVSERLRHHYYFIFCEIYEWKLFSRQAQRSFKEKAEVKLAYFYTCAIEAYVIIPVIVGDRFGFHSGIESRKDIFVAVTEDIMRDRREAPRRLRPSSGVHTAFNCNCGLSSIGAGFYERKAIACNLTNLYSHIIKRGGRQMSCPPSRIY